MNATYTNPVYAAYMADPFVLAHGDVYYAYGTAPASPDGRQFRVLYSRDLIHWQEAGWALAPIENAVEYWAPEVAYHQGRFYLYYSARLVDRDHQLRVAVSDSPTGVFADLGLILTPDDPFTIDAHPYQDVDGTWYLFYSRDFLDTDQGYRVGTGIVVDRLLGMLRLEGKPQVVVRPYADWHLFQAGRSMYGGVYDWHTIEGAAMRRHQGRYYCFYSGGAWERDNYGVSYVVADHPRGVYEKPAHQQEALLRSVPDQVRGPGHNSFVTLPNGQEYIIYHAWDKAMQARLMRIDRLHWESGIPTLAGPTWTPQPAPAVAAIPAREEKP